MVAVAAVAQAQRVRVRPRFPLTLRTPPHSGRGEVASGHRRARVDGPQVRRVDRRDLTYDSTSHTRRA